MCTSDSTSSVGDNIECRENAETQPNGECSAEFGNDYCYVLVTRQKAVTGQVASWQWNSKWKRRFYIVDILMMLMLRRMLHSQGWKSDLPPECAKPRVK